MSAQLSLAKPHMLIVVGIPGSGKSFFASQFSDMFNAPYVDYGRFQGDGLGDYMLHELLKTKQTLVIEGRGTTIVDRRDIIKTAVKSGYNVLFVWVQTEPLTAEHRAVKAKTATLTDSQFATQFKQFENLIVGEPYLVISGKHTYPTQARTVLKNLAAPRTTDASQLIRRLPYRSHTLR